MCRALRMKDRKDSGGRFSFSVVRGKRRCVCRIGNAGRLEKSGHLCVRPYPYTTVFADAAEETTAIFFPIWAEHSMVCIRKCVLLGFSYIYQKIKVLVFPIIYSYRLKMAWLAGSLPAFLGRSNYGKSKVQDVYTQPWRNNVCHYSLVGTVWYGICRSCKPYSVNGRRRQNLLRPRRSQRQLHRSQRQQSSLKPRLSLKVLRRRQR